MTGSIMSIKGCSQIVYFGGGPTLAGVAEAIKLKGIPQYIVISQRHSREMICLSGKKVRMIDYLRQSKIPFIVSRSGQSDPKVSRLLRKRTLGISIGAAWIFPRSFIDSFNGLLVNIHPSRLPEFRGGAVFSWHILMGESNGGASIHLISPGVDAGPIIAKRYFRYPKSCRTPNDYRYVYVKNAVGLLTEFIDDVRANKKIVITRQIEVKSELWPRIYSKIHGFIDWRWSVDELELFVRSFDDPHCGASTFLGTTRLFLKGCRISNKGRRYHPFQSGIVFRKDGHTVFVAAPGGALAIDSVIDERGNDHVSYVQLGDRFVTPSRYLEEARGFRAQFDSKGPVLRRGKR